MFFSLHDAEVCPNWLHEWHALMFGGTERICFSFKW